MPTPTLSTPLNDPVFADLHLHGWGSAYQTELDKLGFPGNTSRDFSKHLLSVTLSESAGEAAMRLDVELHDNTRQHHPSFLTPLTVGTDLHLYGYGINYFLGGTRNEKPSRFFRGNVYKARKSTRAGSRTRLYTAYDPATYLARTEAPLVYVDKTFTEIFKDVCAKYGFQYDDAIETTAKLGKIVMGPGWTLWRLFQECTKRTYDKTGLTYYVRSIPNKGRTINLRNFGDWEGEGKGITWRITDGRQGTLLDHDIEDDAEHIATRIIITQEEYDDEGEFKAHKQIRQGIVIGGIREAFGDLLKILSPDSSLTPVYDEDDNDWSQIDQQLTLQMEQALANYGRTRKKATLRNIYLPGLRRGDRITSGVAGTEMQHGWIVDAVATTWEASGATQTIEVVKHQSDSSVQVGG